MAHRNAYMKSAWEAIVRCILKHKETNRVNNEAWLETRRICSAHTSDAMKRVARYVECCLVTGEASHLFRVPLDQSEPYLHADSVPDEHHGQQGIGRCARGTFGG